MLTDIETLREICDRYLNCNFLMALETTVDTFKFNGVLAEWLAFLIVTKPIEDMQCMG